MSAGPVAFAFAAGMVATINPCGFAMLPAYVSVLMRGFGADEGQPDLAAGFRVGGLITLVFLATFTAVGGMFRFVNDAFVDTLPWVVPFIGIGLIVLGIFTLRGGHLVLPVLGSRRFVDSGTYRSVVLFGLAYALASISCALVVFVSVVTAAATAESVVEGVAVFGAYGLGMGVVLISVAVAVATSRGWVITRFRRLTPYVDRLGGWAMVAAGVFVVYYWAGTLAGPTTTGLVRVRAGIDQFSAWLTGQISDNATGWAIALAAVVAAIGVFEVRRVRRLEGSSAPDR